MFKGIHNRFSRESKKAQLGRAVLLSAGIAGFSLSVSMLSTGWAEPPPPCPCDDNMSVGAYTGCLYPTLNNQQNGLIFLSCYGNSAYGGVAPANCLAAAWQPGTVACGYRLAAAPGGGYQKVWCPEAEIIGPCSITAAGPETRAPTPTLISSAGHHGAATANGTAGVP
jgi:hypothetical protein